MVLGLRGTLVWWDTRLWFGGGKVRSGARCLSGKEVAAVLSGAVGIYAGSISLVGARRRCDD